MVRGTTGASLSGEAVLTAPSSGGPAVCGPGAAGARREAKPPGHIVWAGEGELFTSRSQRGRGEAKEGGEAARSLRAAAAVFFFFALELREVLDALAGPPLGVVV